jgi:uncharacterized Fe-S cluster-containing radical SAM superfamily protein
VFDGLAANASGHGYKTISASASEGTLDRQHLYELLDLVEKSEFVYVLETNGMTLGDDEAFAKLLTKYKNLHVGVSIKGCNPEELHRLTGVRAGAYKLPFKALQHLIDAGVSCNACVSVSFSDVQGIKSVEKQLESINLGIVTSTEIERIKLFPEVRKRLMSEGIRANCELSCVS